MFLGPVVVGLLGTLLPAFGWLPALGETRPSLHPWQRLLDTPGLGRAVMVTLISGLGGTLLAFLAAVLIAAAAHGRPAASRLHALLPPLLAVPHLAGAVGIAFLLAPSGWLARLVSPWLTGWERPPDLLTVNDPCGLALMLALAVRECPFLLLAIHAATPQVDAERTVAVARTLGYGRAEAWLRLVLPQLYPQLRLPLYAVLAFSLSVVDMAIVLGPTTPPPLAVQLWRWFTDPDPTWRLVAAAGALLQLGLLLAALAVWRSGERLLAARWHLPPRGGPNRLPARTLPTLGLIAAAIVFGLGVLSLLMLALWSLARTWRFPATWPQGFGLESWSWAQAGLADAAATTLLLGLLAAGIALVLILACLEHEARSGRSPRAASLLTLAYLPLLVPQISFLFGLQALFVRLGLDATGTGLLWSHLVFVLPYVVLMLRRPYLTLSPHYAAAGQTLGASPARIFRRVKLPLLCRPIAVAFAVGFSVSAAQYLPTLFIGAGRFTTLTTETLALALGGDRRLTAAAALLLSLLPLLVLAAALALPPARSEREA